MGFFFFQSSFPWGKESSLRVLRALPRRCSLLEGSQLRGGCVAGSRQRFQPLATLLPAPRTGSSAWFFPPSSSPRATLGTGNGASAAPRAAKLGSPLTSDWHGAVTPPKIPRASPKPLEQTSTVQGLHPGGGHSPDPQLPISTRDAGLVSTPPTPARQGASSHYCGS